MRQLLILVVLFFSTAVSAQAATAKEDALRYKNCILLMSHVSNTEVETIVRGNGSLNKKASVVANLAAARCEGDRTRLIDQLNAENRTQNKYSEMPDKIKGMCILALKAQILDAVLKGAAQR